MPVAGAALYAQHHFDPTDWVELVDKIHGNVGRPDVVLRVDPQTMRAVEQPVTEAADEMAVRIEFRQGHRPAMEDKDVAFGVKGDARRAAEIRAWWQMEGFGNRDVGERRKFHSLVRPFFI